MAKIRRVIRKVKTGAEPSFDDQAWPVNASLVILGGFLAGVVLAYLRFDDPRLLHNAWTSLAAIVLVLGGAMVAMHFITNRMLRRGTQLAAVLAAIFHLLLILAADRYRIFGREPLQTARVEDLQRQRVVTPDYHPQQLQRPPDEKPDFEKPVETETPEPEMREVERERQPERTAEQPQPTPTPERQPSTEPDLIRRPEPQETTPRAAEQTSQLSRRTAQQSLSAQQAPVEATSTPQTRPRNPQPRPADVAVSRQASPSASAAAGAAPAAEASSAPRTNPLTRRSAEPSEQASATAARTVPRRATQMSAPPTTVTTETQQAAARQTNSSEPRPQQTAIAKRQTASPRTDAETPQLNVETPLAPATELQRQRVQSAPQPTVAQAPRATPNQRTRATSRPDAAALSQVDSPTPVRDQPTATPTVQPQASRVVRAAPAATVRKQVMDEPTSPAATPAALTRQAPRTAPDSRPTTLDTSTLRRRTASLSPAPSTESLVRQPTAVANSSQAAELSPSSTAVAKQNTVVEQTASEVSDASSASRSRADNALASAAPGARRQTEAAPAVRPTPDSPSRRRSATRNAPAISSNAAGVASNSPPAESQPSTLQASSTAVATRQATSPAVQPARQSRDEPSNSPAALAARATSRRTESSATPTIQPEAAATPSPSRAQRVAALSSPTIAANPATRQTSEAAGPPAAQPAATALSKGETGMAGVGRSANLDRSAPAAESPSLVASASATRRQAVQETPEGPALAPSTPAVTPRSRATQATPATRFLSQDVPVANATGGAQVAEMQAASSAAVNQALSNAARDTTTAAQGEVEVDLGPTRLVSGGGAASRAAGGGQPELNFEQQAEQLARRDAGASQMAIAAEQVAPTPSAPAGDGGGQAKPVQVEPATTSLARTEAGGAEPVSGQPAFSDELGPAAAAAANSAAGEPLAARAESPQAEPAAGGGEQGQPDDDEDEEEKARRLARRRKLGGAPQLALTAPAIGTAPATPAAEAGSAASALAMAANEEAARMGRTATESSPAMERGAELISEQPAGLAARQGDARLARAEPAESTPGAPAPGGGRTTLSRRSMGPPMTTATQAEVIQLSGSEQSAGAAEGSALAASETGVGRTSSSPSSAAAIGQLAAPEDQGDGRSTSGVAAARASSSADAMQIAALEASPAGSRRSARREIRPGGAGMIEVDTSAMGGEASAADLQVVSLSDGGSVGPLVRQPSGALTVNVDLPEAEGGLGAAPAAEIGVNSRRANRDSIQLATRAARFLRRNTGGAPNINTTAVAAAAAFQGRSRGKASGRFGPQTEESIELGLTFLARYQQEDGRWQLQGFPGDPAPLMVSDTAATGLALLAFQGAGYHHLDHQYQTNCSAAVEFLVKHQAEDGDLYLKLDAYSNRAAWLYSHGIASLALCEAYGMTGDPKLREPAQKALDFIIASQNERTGGWRYSPGVSADTSVTGWMMMALKSGRLAGLDVPDKTFERIQYWLDRSSVGADKAEYRYNPDAPETPTQRHGRLVSHTMTSVGLLMRFYSGWNRETPGMQKGADSLLDHLPEIGAPGELKRDTYYWYYATQVMFHMRGEYWEQWNARLHPLLLDSQIQQGPMAGSWQPSSPIPDRWAAHGGRLYLTALNLLSLEVRHRAMPLNVFTGQ